MENSCGVGTHAVTDGVFFHAWEDFVIEKKTSLLSLTLRLRLHHRSGF